LITFYDIGGILGSSIVGWISDIIKIRTLLVFVMLFLAIPVMFIELVVSDPVIFYFLVPMCGILLSGSANLISTAITADYSQTNDNRDAKATVVGIINGTGSLGAAFG